MRHVHALLAMLLIIQSVMAAEATTRAVRRPATQPLSREQWAAPAVEVKHEGTKWTIDGHKHHVIFDETDFAIEVRAGDVAWHLAASGATDMLVKSGGDEFALPLKAASRIAVEPYDTGFKTGIKVTLSDWPTAGALKLFLTIALEGKDEDLVFDVAAEERTALLRRLDWPGAIDGKEVDYTVLSNYRGVLLPRNWPKPFFPIRATNADGSAKAEDTSEVQSNVIESWSMSWWGFEKGPAAMMV